MTIDVKDSGAVIDVEIKGLIKGNADSQSFKDAIEPLSDKKARINVNIVDSFAITSTIIGYLRKKVHKDKMDLHIIVHHHTLYELLSELNLIDALNVTQG